MSLEHYDAVIADLESRRDKLTAMIDSLRELQAGLAGQPIPPSPPGGNGGGVRQSATGEVSFASDAFFGKSIPEAAKCYLAAMKRTRPNSDVCAALQAGGLTSSAKNFGETVRAILTRNPDFVKVNGEWGLVEWYPGYRAKKRKSGEQEPESKADATEDRDGITDQPQIFAVKGPEAA